jgi:hypothetical protein
MTACVLVFLFAFHAKTGVYGGGLKVKPHTATSSKLWMKNPKTLERPAPISLIANSTSFHSRDLTWGLVFLHLPVASGFVPVPCFSGSSPPPFAQERL